MRENGLHFNAKLIHFALWFVRTPLSPPAPTAPADSPSQWCNFSQDGHCLQRHPALGNTRDYCPDGQAPNPTAPQIPFLRKVTVGLRSNESVSTFNSSQTWELLMTIFWRDKACPQAEANVEQTRGEKQRDDRAGGSQDFPSHPLAPEARPPTRGQLISFLTCVPQLPYKKQFRESNTIFISASPTNPFYYCLLHSFHSVGQICLLTTLHIHEKTIYQDYEWKIKPTHYTLR